MSPMEPFCGEETFAADPARVFTALTDLEVLAGALPGVESAQRVDERTMAAVVRPGLTFLSGRLRVTLTLVESQAPSSAVLHAVARGIGASLAVESRLTVAPRDGGTVVGWEARVREMSGLLAAVPVSLVRAAAEKAIRDAWSALRSRIEP